MVRVGKYLSDVFLIQKSQTRRCFIIIAFPLTIRMVQENRGIGIERQLLVYADVNLLGENIKP
jgi:hypothetical protein